MKNLSTTSFISQYFAGSLSGNGFINHLDEYLKEIKTVYIIKGTPGSGKSTLMKKIASAAEDFGFEADRIFCSSDPLSLDGIIIPPLSFAIVDGTSPHVIEPSYPLAKETIINTADHIQVEKVKPHFDDIFFHTDEKKKFFSKTRPLLKSALILERAKLSFAKEYFDFKKCLGFFEDIIKIEKENSSGFSSRRSLVTFGKNGYTSLLDKIPFHKAYGLNENFSTFILDELRNFADRQSLSYVFSPSPLDPSTMCAIYLTDTKQLFANERFLKKEYITFPKELCEKNGGIGLIKEKLTFFSKTQSLVLDECQKYISDAMDHHYMLEKIYSKALNTDSLDCLARSIIVSIFENH